MLPMKVKMPMFGFEGRLRPPRMRRKRWRSGRGFSVLVLFGVELEPQNRALPAAPPLETDTVVLSAAWCVCVCANRLLQSEESSLCSAKGARNGCPCRPRGTCGGSARD